MFKKVRTAFLTRFADAAVINGPYLISSVPNYDLIIPYARDLEKITKFKKVRQRITENRKLIVLHVPSDPEVKGTSYVKEAFKNLAPKYPNVEFKILDFMPYDELLQEMAKADIVIDQLLVGWYGGQSVEAMALGSAVMCFIEPTYLENVPFAKTLPIANTTIFSLEKDLEDLINDPERQRELAEAGPDFANKYHASERVADAYQKVYEEVLK
jgi:glycosyltransferase involved in cell wall biosynthesis